MSYKVLEQNGVDNENIDGGAFNHFAAGGRDGIIKGVLSECALTTVGNGVGIAPGLIVICGIRVKIIETEALFLSGTPMTATRYQIVVQASLQSNRNLSVSFLLRPVSALRQDALYAAEQGVYEAEIGRFTHLTSGTIEDMVRTLDIISGGTSVDGANEINIGNVTTQTLAPGMDAEVDVENRYDAEQNKFVTDFTFSIPQGEDGKGTLSNEDGDSTVNGFTQAAVKGIAQARNFYHLGAFDTYVSNGDGTGTVNRNTGYLRLDGTESWSISPSNTSGKYRLTANVYVSDITELQSDRNKYYVANCATATASGTWGAREEGVAIDGVHNGVITFYSEEFNTQDSLPYFKEWLSRNPIIIQYLQNATYSFSEHVIDNQPIRPANQDEEYYWHEEYEKGLNLLDSSNIAGGVNADGLLDGSRLYVASISNNSELNKYAGLKVILEPNRTYTLTEFGTNAYYDTVRIYERNENGEPILPGIKGNQITVSGDNFRQTFQTYAETEIYILVYLQKNTSSGNYSYVDLMLVNGNVPHSYIPHNGEIVREKDLSGIQLFPDDVNPAQAIGGDWDDLGEITTSTGVLLHVYRRM